MSFILWIISEYFVCIIVHIQHNDSDLWVEDFVAAIRAPLGASGDSSDRALSKLRASVAKSGPFPVVTPGRDAQVSWCWTLTRESASSWGFHLGPGRATAPAILQPCVWSWVCWATTTCRPTSQAEGWGKCPMPCTRAVFTAKTLLWIQSKSQKWKPKIQA